MITTNDLTLTLSAKAILALAVARFDVLTRISIYGEVEIFTIIIIITSALYTVLKAIPLSI
jgi:hypothetical protein